MIKLNFPIASSPKNRDLKKEGSLTPVIDYPGCDREIPFVAGVPPTSKLGCADSCKYGGHCQRERELLK
ncbi:hypothetical protein COT65_00785 [Candidatus Shapirobacteria bacterium CG09_land_8_20_14_0_10_47_13]|uniref:Uncharacterized protein n=1 Tax=Candidatus Shapirobacteria bacterium CG09_land_8_20_14_0_10_47_13 TaxID=1974481 RepID=A0A2H0WN79_9BACT|nr:MAG: hypothetical protein COT65_00785 [Candidatus Shapirobacteria bacterium CG09_land_8_20_14_0_10_47_13]